MSRPRRVLHIITRMNVGGAGGYALDVCRLLPPGSFDCRILSGLEPEHEGSLAGACADAGVELIRVPTLSRTPNPLRDRSASTHIRRVIGEWQPDLLHTHTAKAGLLGRWVGHRAGVPSVHHVHGWSFAHQRPAVASAAYRMLEARAAKWCSKLLTVCLADIEIGLAAGIGNPNQYELAPAGIDVAGIAEGAKTADPELLKWKGDSPLVAFMGRLCSQKDPLTFVQMAHSMAAERPDGCRFAIVGDGPDADRTARAVADGPAADRTRVQGFTHNVPAVLGAIDVLVHPSRHEGLPRMLLEAMASGTPVVGTAVDGCAEILDHEATAMVVEPGDSEASARATWRLLDDPSLASGLCDAAWRSVVKFDIETCIETLAKVYEEVLPPTSQA